MKQHQAYRNQRQHKKAALRKFEVGDVIFLKTRDTFKSRFIGPFSAQKVISDVLILVKDMENEVAEPFSINIDKVIPAHKRKQHFIPPYVPAMPLRSTQNPPTTHDYFLRTRKQ